MYPEWLKFYLTPKGSVPQWRKDVLIPYVMERENFVIYSSPVCHIVPTIGLRIDYNSGRKIIVYSSDTEICESLENLARDADVLIHEATGASIGHSTAEQAAQLAASAKVKQLYLVHYPPEDIEDESILHAAQKRFKGGVEYARDLQRIQLDG